MQITGKTLISLFKTLALETVIGLKANSVAQYRSGEDAAQGALQPTGVFFHEPSSTGLMAAIDRFESQDFSVGALRASAARFGRQRFEQEIRSLIREVLA